MSEIDALISTYTDSTSCEPLHKRLATVPISALEDELPSLDLVIREVLRLTLNGTMLRRNVLEDLVVCDKVVHKGAFMAYPLPDIHLNSNIYSDPYKFDPDRFSEGREEDKKEAFSYMAWGGGRHPCTGMRVAKLEIKMITALFLASYEYKLVDAFGNHPIPFPQLDRNDIQKVPSHFLSLS
jgi:cytochrome P450